MVRLLSAKSVFILALVGVLLLGLLGLFGLLLRRLLVEPDLRRLGRGGRLLLSTSTSSGLRALLTSVFHMLLFFAGLSIFCFDWLPHNIHNILLHRPAAHPSFRHRRFLLLDLGALHLLALLLLLLVLLALLLPFFLALLLLWGIVPCSGKLLCLGLGDETIKPNGGCNHQINLSSTITCLRPPMLQAGMSWIDSSSPLAELSGDSCSPGSMSCSLGQPFCGW